MAFLTSVSTQTGAHCLPLRTEVLRKHRIDKAFLRLALDMNQYPRLSYSFVGRPPNQPFSQS